MSGGFANSCPDVYSPFTLPLSYLGFTTSTGLDPCNRSEWLYYNGANTTTHTLTIASFDLLSGCTYGGAFVKPDLVEVGFSLNGGASWQVLPNLGAGSSPVVSSGFLRQNDAVTSNPITPGTYPLTFRIRNWRYTITPFPSPLIVPNNTNACHTVGVSSDPNGYSSYQYLYFGPTVI